MLEQKKRYLAVKISTTKFERNLELLSQEQRKEVDLEVDKLYQLQSAILNSPEASQVTPSIDDIEAAYKECQGQFDSEGEFFQSLNKQNLTPEGIKFALKDELHCDAVMGLVSDEFPPLSQQVAQKYYDDHRIEFSRLRTWKVSQILITINDDYPENTRPNALARINKVREELESGDFADLAMRHSECPSAMNGGDLGWCEEGKLYAEITDALIRQQSGEVSQPIETEAGFHIVSWCESKPPYVAPFEEALPFLQQKHETRARAYMQRQWLQGLLAKSA